MHTFVDLSNNRAHLSERVERLALSRSAVAAIEEMCAGDNYRVLPLGGPSATERAQTIVSRHGAELVVARAYVQYLRESAAYDGVVVGRAVHEHVRMPAGATLRHYLPELTPLAPERIDNTAAHVAALQSHGSNLMGAVATIADIHSDASSNFDALYVPKVWEELLPPAHVAPREHAIALTAGYMVLGMTGPQYSPN